MKICRMPLAVILPAILTCFLINAGSPAFVVGEEAAFPKITNTQKEGENPTTAQEAADAITVPAGFEVTLFAGEPDVSQPVSMEMDDRGRIWVAEFYTYAGRGFDESLRDRIVILEDVDGDGKHDKRTVFWDQGDRLTSVLPGSNGCWILNAGTLAWLSDKDGDDKADGEPEIFLDGFDQNQVGHNIVSGLMYGPTGWIYGRHGIQATSLVGPPGMPQDQRTKMNCSIWRFHPQDHRFQLVTEGTTNPWGLDYNEYGDFFFTNNVIGHAWHAIPGAHFKRMYGADFNPHFYELIDQHADHYHWDHSANWTDSREGNGVHGKLGGGHSHCGGMIYLGDNFPDEYRGRLFMCNTHGRRVNCDIPVREGAGYVIEHRKDFMFANQPWFRGVGLMYGPDGEVYVSDWTDLGECHDSDGVHRTSGRIYRITYGKPEKHFTGDLAELSNPELMELQCHTNDWYSRHARRILFDRFWSSGESFDIKEIFTQEKPKWFDDTIVSQLKIGWVLFSVDAFPERKLRGGLSHANEHLRAWSVRLLSDQASVKDQTWKLFCEKAAQEKSAYVRLSYASAMRVMPLEYRIQMAHALALHAEDVNDHDMRLIMWYGLEPAVTKSPEKALELTKNESIPKLRNFIARRLMHESVTNPEMGPLLVSAVREADSKTQKLELLAGMVAATQGIRQLPKPAGWDELVEEMAASDDPKLKEAVRDLSLVFGDGRAMQELIKLVTDGNANPIDRIAALEFLAERKDEALLPILKKSLNDRVIDTTAIQALARYDDAETPKLLLNQFNNYKKPPQAAALETLASRPAYARELLKAMKENRLKEAVLSASQARQISQFGDEEINKLLEDVWGSLTSTPAAKQEQIDHLKAELTAESLANANLSNGRIVFNQTCSNCHRLFNAGKNLAPDLTGGNRMNLDYLLENIVTPSALVPNQYKVTTFVLDSGRVINGVIKSETDQTVTVQTEKDEITLAREEIEISKPSNLSLMPDGVLDKMSPEQIRDLIGYLQSDRQIEVVAE